MQSLTLAKPQIKPQLKVLEPLRSVPKLSEPEERSLRPYQDDLKKEVYAHYKNGAKSVLVIAGGGMGKAQPLTSKILTPGGFKSMGEIEVGDLVTSANGGFSRVTGVYPQGQKEVFRIHFSDGSSTLCCDEHLWNVQSHAMTRHKGYEHWETMPLHKIRETYIRHRKVSDRIPSGMEMRYRIPLVKPVEFFPIREPLPIDAYAVGLLLGDGGLSTGNIIFSCPDVQLQESLKTLLPKPCHLKETGWNGGIDFRITGEKQYNPTLTAIRSMGLGGCKSEEKFIPEMYKYASIDDRLAIIQGLLDTDGYAAGASCVEYVTVSPMLADGVKFIVNSLGGTVSTNEKSTKFTYKGERKTGQLAYRIIVKLPEGMNPFRLERKLEKYNKTSQNRYKPRRMIVGIEPEGIEECQCIIVDSPDHLYVTDDFIVTHNTTVAAWIMRDRSVRAKSPARSIFLVEKNCLLDQAYDTLVSLGVDCSIIQASRKVKWEHPCMVASLQTLRSWHDRDPKLLRSLDMAIVLLCVLAESPLTPLLAKMLAAIPSKDAIVEAHDGGDYLRKMLGKVGMFVLDEAHDGVGQKIYQTLVKIYSSDEKCKFLGLTASPWRMNPKEWLGRWYDAKVESLQPPEAIKAGWLVPSRNFSIPGVLDVSEIGTQEDGDYSAAVMGKQAMRPEALQVVVNNWLLRAKGKPTICFCSTVAQAKAQAECFVANGIVADYQHGDTKKGSKEHHEKEMILTGKPPRTRYSQDLGLRTGDLQVICSVNTHKKGYDCPPIACVIFTVGTKSKSGFFQGVWRGCRPITDKDRALWRGPKPLFKDHFVLLDFGMNLANDKGGGHGDPMGYHDYDISEPRPKKRSDEPVNMIKDCPECGAELSIFARACECGHEFGKSDEDDGQESLFDPSLYLLKEWFDPIGCERIQYLRSQKRRCYHENLNPDIAAEAFLKRYGFVPPADWHQWAVMGKRSGKAARKQYETYLSHHARHELWTRVQMRLEFGDGETVPKYLAVWNQPWWEVLGVSQIDSKEAVKAAYLCLAKQWHPDTCDDRDNAETQMKLLNKAWEEYKDGQIQRRNYTSTRSHCKDF